MIGGEGREGEVSWSLSVRVFHSGRLILLIGVVLNVQHRWGRLSIPLTSFISELFDHETVLDSSKIGRALMDAINKSSGDD